MWQVRTTSNHFVPPDKFHPAIAQIAGDASDGDDWACDYIDHFDIGPFEPFGKLYIPGFDDTDLAKGVNSFLIARTVATFGRSSDKYASEDIALCMAFHDQDPIVRVYEA